MSVLIFLADGFEETEALCPLDVLRRAGVDVITAGIGGREIRSSHGVVIKADALLDDIAEDGYDAVFCPGGMPGAENIASSEKAVRICINASKHSLISAICASPAVVLGPAGILDGKKATCYPSCASYSPSIDFLPDGVVRDGNVLTGKSAGWAFDLGLELVSMLKGRDKAESVRSSIYYKD